MVQYLQIFFTVTTSIIVLFTSSTIGYMLIKKRKELKYDTVMQSMLLMIIMCNAILISLTLIVYTIE